MLPDDLGAALQGLLDTVHQRVVVEGLLHEVEGAALDGRYSSGHVTMSGKKDHRQHTEQLALDQPFEQDQTARAGYAHVQEQATG